MTKHLHLHHNLNPPLTRITKRDHGNWYSPYPHEQDLGATTLSLPDFLTAAYTWINLSTHPDTMLTNISHAINALARNNAPNRTLALTNLQPHTIGPHHHMHQHIRVHTLAEFPPNSLPHYRDTLSCNPLHISTGFGKQTPTLNTQQLYLILLEHPSTPAFHWPNLLKDFRAEFPATKIHLHKPPWLKNHTTDAFNQTAKPSTPRNPQHLYPGLQFYRFIPRKDHHFPTAPDIMLTLLGEGPPQLRNHLLKAGYPTDSLNSEQIATIRTLIRRATLAAYSRMERQARNKKYDSHICRAPSHDAALPQYNINLFI